MSVGIGARTIRLSPRRSICSYYRFGWLWCCLDVGTTCRLGPGLDVNAKPASVDAPQKGSRFRNNYHTSNIPSSQIRGFLSLAMMDPHHGFVEPFVITNDEPSEVSTFPMTREEFDTDPRVSWSRISGKWSLEADDGSEFEFDEALKRWIPVVCFFMAPILYPP